MKDIHRISLGELLKLERRPVKVVPDGQYAEIGIYCFGRGIFHKMPRSGLEVGDKNLFLIKEGDFILQVTFAWEGAVGLVSSAEDGMYGSSRFPTFRIDESRCFPPYLVNYFKTREGREQLVKISPGSAGRNRVLSLRRIPEILVPLPPLSKQRRIVARIEELTARIEEARRLRQQLLKEAEALVVLEYGKIFAELKLSNQLPLNKIVTEVGQQVQASQMEYFDYPYLSLENIESRTGRILRFRTCQEAGIRGTAVLFGTEDVLYSKLRPYLNKVVTPSFEGCATTELVVFKPDTTIVDKNYVAAFLRNPHVVKESIANSVGTKMPRTNMRWFRQLLVPVPPLPEQRRIVTYLNNLQTKVGELNHLQCETAVELDALLPSILDKAFKGEFE